MEAAADDSPAALLEACADVLLRCNDGVDIPISKFSCMSASPVLREALRLHAEVDDKGRAILMLPRASTGLTLAMNVIHATRSLYTFSIEEAFEAIEGFDFLGGGSLGNIMAAVTLQHAWSLLTNKGLDGVKPYLQRLLDSPATRDAVLTRLSSLCIGWLPFVESMASVSVDLKIGTAIMAKLGKFYPPIMLLRFVLDRLTCKSPETVLAVAAQQGVYYHPAEVLEAMHEVEDEVGPTIAPLIRTWIDGLSTVESAPRFSGLSASIVSYHESTMSILFDFEDFRPGARQSRRFAAWLVLHWAHPALDAIDGFDAHITMGKIDRDGRAAKRLDARMMGFDENDNLIYERWHSFPSIDPRDTLRLSDGAAIYEGPRMHGRVNRLRLDLFYSGNSPVWRALY